ncbi:hypothetical protein CDAR_613431 [Caerostris darwini]|uniref:Uncharacterized protein n=1 Tax=Caerostris darwini TaxID=1538125 RepID=A0AAV4UMV7_9ARAC|nr:hypothetical protein CDAR_613431 [Caerostris darwini]
MERSLNHSMWKTEIKTGLLIEKHDSTCSPPTNQTTPPATPFFPCHGLNNALSSHSDVSESTQVELNTPRTSQTTQRSIRLRTAYLLEPPCS